MAMWKVYPRKNKCIYDNFHYTKDDKKLKITEVYRYRFWIYETYNDNPPNINNSTNLFEIEKEDKNIKKVEEDYKRFYKYGNRTYECTSELSNSEYIDEQEIEDPEKYGWEIIDSELICTDPVIEKIPEQTFANAMRIEKRQHVELPANYIPTKEEEYMNPYQIEYFRKLILDKQQRLSSEYQKEISDRTVPRNISKQIALSKILIERIDEGLMEYGWSEHSGLEIGIGRLLANPLAVRTIEEQERWEEEIKAGVNHYLQPL